MGAAMSSCWPSMEENERKLLGSQRYSTSSSGGATDEFPPSPISRRQQRNMSPHTTQPVEKKRKKSRKASRIVSDLQRTEAQKNKSQYQDEHEEKVRRRKETCAASGRTMDSFSTCAEIVDTKNLDRIFDRMQTEERSLWAQYGSDVFTPVTSDFNEWSCMLPQTASPSY